MQKGSWFGAPGRPNGIDQPCCACANRCVGGVDKRQVDRRLGRDGISHVEARACKTRHERFMSLYVLVTVLLSSCKHTSAPLQHCCSILSSCNYISHWLFAMLRILLEGYHHKCSRASIGRWRCWAATQRLALAWTSASGP